MRLAVHFADVDLCIAGGGLGPSVGWQEALCTFSVPYVDRKCEAYVQMIVSLLMREPSRKQVGSDPRMLAATIRSVAALSLTASSPFRTHPIAASDYRA